MKRNRNPTNRPVMKRYATLDSPFGSRSFSYRPSIRKRYGNNTETIRDRAKDERKTNE